MSAAVVSPQQTNKLKTTLNGTNPGTTCLGYRADFPESENTINLKFNVEEAVGSLAKALRVFEKHSVNLIHLESRPSDEVKGTYDFYVSCDDSNGGLDSAIVDLKKFACSLTVLSRPTDKLVKNDDGLSKDVPDFPRKFADLDNFANQIASYGAELECDHPGFKDEVYRKRRTELTDLAFNYKHYQQLPLVEYTPDEVKTWSIIFKELTKLFPTHACDEFNSIWPVLVSECGYSENNIPQLRDVSSFLKDRTGFTLRPVAGLMSSRDFLAGLAFRVFHSTHDVCHELIGHIPLLADPAFAQFSQEIGLASLGVSDEYIEKLATCYWFTVEFGLCRQHGSLRVFGAGLLSSIGEIQYALGGKPEIRKFDPFTTCITKYPIIEYQPVYFESDSFEIAKQQLCHYAESIPRDFCIRYDPNTQSVKIINDVSQAAFFTSEIIDDIGKLHQSLKKLAGNQKSAVQVAITSLKI